LPGYPNHAASYLATSITFDICIDGLKAEALKLPGKPEPAVLLEIARRLNIHPSRSVLFEDSLAGAESGKRGGFKCVVGIDHGKQRDVSTARRPSALAPRTSFSTP
jgi:beta-phosphoglucomutase-like phosphatase (HAD superfamily)